MVTGVFALAAIAPDPASADASFKLTGGGWGHGIGLSQYGAQGYALKGWPYTDILRWYYGGDRDGSSTGMRVATLAWVGYFANPKVQVNLDKADASRTSWTLRGWNARLKVSDDTTTTYLTKDVYYTFTASSGKVKVNGKTYTGTVAVEAESGSPALAVVKDASGPFSYTYVRYRGQLRLTASGSVIRLVNLVPMEQYLYGVVPRESPASWNAEALKAQAVAARSYAWATNPPSSPTATWLSGILHCTTYSQVYAGHTRLV
jgi:peptidoglycan hydrolase-like amidase